jgi:hypothetical protein
MIQSRFLTNDMNPAILMLPRNTLYEQPEIPFPRYAGYFHKQNELQPELAAHRNILAYRDVSRIP